MKLKTRAMVWGLMCAAVVSISARSSADYGVSVPAPYAGFQPASVPGFVVLAQHRFDPMVQRWLAEQSLKALPIHNGQLFYIIPVDTDPLQEQMQIRYIEEMLRRQPIEPGAR